MVDKKTVEYVAGLARIAVTDEEKDFLAKQLSKIIDYIDKLKELPTENVEPMRELNQPRDVLRSDIVKVSEARDRILGNSPSREGDYFKIPKVIE